MFTPLPQLALLLPTGSHCVRLVALALGASLLVGCVGGPAAGLRDPAAGGFLGGRYADAQAPVSDSPSPIAPAPSELGRPPLLAQLDALLMPPRPGSPTAPADAANWVSPAPAETPLALLKPNSTTGGQSRFPVIPAVFSSDPLVPSNDRDWVPEHKVLAWAELNGDELTIHNVRNCEFYSYRDCIVQHEDRKYRLSDLRTVDFLVVPFTGAEALAHTMLSFGFANGEYLGVSVEVRLEKGEQYHPVGGLLKQFEIIYVVADERDLIRVRVEHRNCEVLAYRSTATPAQARALLIDILNRVNHLHDNPEFYDTLSNNCTTNIVRHINRLAPGRVPYDYRVLLPGFADHLAYELGLIDNSIPFAQLKAKARVNDLALRYKDSEHFSAQIRGETVRR